jgi:hypothetical protein
MQDTWSRRKNILFLYRRRSTAVGSGRCPARQRPKVIDFGRWSFWQTRCSRPAFPRSRHPLHQGLIGTGPKRRAQQQELVELGRIVAVAVRSGDEDLPSLSEERPSLGDGDDDAQAHGDRDIFAFGCVHNEGHNDALRDIRPMSRSSNFRSSVEPSAAASRTAIRKRVWTCVPWPVRSENPPAPASRPDAPRGASGSRFPATGRPSVFACDGFPSTRRPGRFLSRKRRRKRICEVKDGASENPLIRSQSLPDGSAGGSPHPIRSREGEGDWDRSRSSAAACEREFASTGCCRAGCRSRSP